MYAVKRPNASSSVIVKVVESFNVALLCEAEMGDRFMIPIGVTVFP
jgi:hypothetical protein